MDAAKTNADVVLKDFSAEEISNVDATTTEAVKVEVDAAASDADGAEDLSTEQVDAAKGENVDPEKPKTNLKAKLKSVWKTLGSYLKGAGKFSVKLLGEYYKW